MKKIILWSTSIAVVVFILVTLFILTKDYRMSKEDSFVPYVGAVDLYHASREELIAMDMCQYSRVFGEVNDAKKASEVAKKVVEELYQKNESPYIVKYNEIADAWVVRGSLPYLHLGGVASVAIDKKTGEILMVIHTK